MDDDEDCGGKGAACTSGSVDFFYELTHKEMEKFERVVSREAVIAPGTDLPRFDVIPLCKKPCLHNIERILPPRVLVRTGRTCDRPKGSTLCFFFMSKIHHHRWRAGRIVDIIGVTAINV